MVHISKNLVITQTPPRQFISNTVTAQRETVQAARYPDAIDREAMLPDEVQRTARLVDEVRFSAVWQFKQRVK